MPLNQTMSEVLIRNTISNINFIIEYNLDMNLPNEADDSHKFLNDLINVDKERDINTYFSDDRENENAEGNKRLSKKSMLNTENNYSDDEEGKKITFFFFFENLILDKVKINNNNSFDEKLNSPLKAHYEKLQGKLGVENKFEENFLIRRSLSKFFY